MNARPAPTVDGHTSVEVGTPPTKEGYISPYSVPWHRQKKWRILMFIGAILLVGAIAGGVAGGVVASKNRSKSPSTTPTSTTPTSTSSSFNAPLESTSLNAALPGSSQPPVASASGADTVPTPTGSGNSAGPSRVSTLNLGGDNFNDATDPGQVSAPVVVWSD